MQQAIARRGRLNLKTSPAQLGNFQMVLLTLPKPRRSSRTYRWMSSVCALTAFVCTYAHSQTADPSVERGKYLATVGNCISCHTAEGKPDFSGGVLFETPFGSIYSTNITSDSEAGIGSWTKEEFIESMRHGVRADGADLYPVFPFPAFTKVVDEDLDAIWAYLQTVPPATEKPPANKLGFPFNMRWLMGVWKVLFFEEGPYAEDTSKSAEWNRGAYIVQGLAHCGACHTPRNSFGAEDQAQFLAGASYLDKVGNGESRPWYAVNLTSAAAGLQAWSVDDIQRYLLTGHNSRAGTFGPMNEVIENSTQHFSAADALAVATYLKELPALEKQTAAPTPEQVRAGSFLYDIHCGTCHLPTGLGDPDIGTPLVGSPIVNAEDPSSLINVILYGALVPHTLTGPGSWKSMDPLGDKLDDEEVIAISNFIRGSWSNSAPPVTEADVKKQR